MARRRGKGRVGRPPESTKEITVNSYGQLWSWPIKGIKEGKYELALTDDLLLRKGYNIYREMRMDDQIKACLWFKKFLVTGRAWEITPNKGKEANEQDKKIAKFAEDALRELDMNRILKDMLTALDFGFSAGEIIWKIDEVAGEEGPKLLVKDIKFRDPEWIKVDVDVHGNVKGLRQLGGTTIAIPGEIYIPADKMLLFTYQGHFGNHYGTSDLRAAYVAWWSKKFVTQFYNVFLERFGSPLMMMKYPQGSTPELKSALQSIMTGLSSKTDILVPEGVVVELIEATRAGTAKYDEALNHFDIRISRAILVPALLGMGIDTKRGSDSQSRLHLRVLMKVVNDLSQDIARVITKSVLEPMIDANFTTESYPSFTFQDYGEYEAVEIADGIREMFNSGVLDLDQEDINYCRSIFGLALRKEGDEDEVIRTPPPPIGNPTQNPNETGTGAGQSNNRAKKGPSTKRSGRPS